MGQALPEWLYKLGLLGHFGAGKGCLATRFACDIYSTAYDPTGDYSVRKLLMLDDERCLIELEYYNYNIDSYSALFEHSLKGIDGYGLVFSSTDRASFEAAKHLQSRVEALRVDWEPKPQAVVLIATKVDLESESDCEVEEWAQELGCKYFKTSALTGDGVSEVFEHCVRELRRQRQISDQRARTSNLVAVKEKSPPVAKPRGVQSIWAALLRKMHE